MRRNAKLMAKIIGGIVAIVYISLLIFGLQGFLIQPRLEIHLNTAFFAVSVPPSLIETHQSQQSSVDQNDQIKMEIPRPPKKILLWTGYYTYNNWEHYLYQALGNQSSITVGNNHSCVFTSERSLDTVKNASVVVFHGRNFDPEDQPPVRYGWQRWIFYNMESPVHVAMDSYQMMFARFSMAFNWTMGYQRNSNVYTPYGLITKKQTPMTKVEGRNIARKIHGFLEGLNRRAVDAVWIVSHCDTQSMREEYIDMLALYGITVEVWGRCATTARLEPNEQWKSPEHVGQFFRRYRFYLAFENSLCSDYVSEKAFAAYYNNFNYGLIPIVFGSANYSQHLPSNSYIDASNMKPEQLANLMNDIKRTDFKNRTKLIKYYQWQYQYELQYEIDPENHYFARDYGLNQGWKTLCSKLWQEETEEEGQMKEKVSNFTQKIDLDSALGTCYEPQKFV